MKQTIYFALAVLSICTILNTSCNKIKEAVKADINLTYSDVEFTIPQITAAGPATLSSKDVYLNIDSIIKASNTKLSAGNIRSVTIKSCVVNMIDGDAANNFSALESCKVDFSSNVNTQLYSLAEITNNPDTEAYTLEIPVNSSINLKDYFNATTFSYTLAGNARKTTSKEIKCKATIKYTLEAGL